MNNEYVIKKETLQSIGNAIRSLNGDENLLSPSTMANNLTDFKANLDATIAGQDQLINQLVLKTNKLLAAHNALQSDYDNLLIDYQNKINELETERESWAGSLTFTSTSSTKYNTATYYTEAGCSLAVDKQKGMAFVTIQGGTSTSYEKIYFTAASLPAGVTMQSYNEYFYGSTGNTKDYYTVGLTGITGKINVVVDFNYVNSSYDYTRAALTVTYA